MEKTKTNKKNKSSIVVLLVAILLCVAIVFSLSGVTLAKYISSKEVTSQTANVAKWGYVLSVDSSKLFGDMYSKTTADTKDDSGTVTKVTNQTVVAYGDTTAAVGVQATADSTSSKGYSDVVAPGTEGYVTFSITGIAEVRSAITIAAGSSYNESTKTWDTTTKTVTLTAGSGSNAVNYEPIKWTLASKSSESGDYTTVSGWESGKSYSEMITALNALDNSTTDENGTTNAGWTDIAPNTTQNLYYKLSWAWALETEKTAAQTDSDGNVTTAATYYNLEDTILGACMAAGESATSSAPYTKTPGPNGETISIYYDSSSQNYNVTVTEVGATTSTTYTATTSVSLGLTVSVAQIQGTAPTNNEETEDENS